MDLQERLLVRWLQLKGLHVYGASLHREDGELIALVFNTDNINSHFVAFANKKPELPETSLMSLEEQAEAMLSFFKKDANDWVAYYKHVVALAEDLKARLKLEMVVTSADNGIDQLVKECGIPIVLEACVPWVLPTAAEEVKVDTPPSKVIRFEPPAIAPAAKPPQHPDSSIHISGVPDARKAVGDHVGDLFDGTEPVDPGEIVEVGDVLDQAALRG